jgi:hypothetical protein
MAKQAEDGYLAEVFGKIAARYLVMAEDALRSPERGGVIGAASSLGQGGGAGE